MSPIDEKYRIVLPREERSFNLTSREDKLRHQVARNGDHLMISFLCNLCHFRNLKGLDSGKGDDGIKLPRTIRRATINAFWTREHSTVEATRRYSKRIVELSQSLDLSNALLEMKPFILNDTQEMSLVILF